MKLHRREGLIRKEIMGKMWRRGECEGKWVEDGKVRRGKGCEEGEGDEEMEKGNGEVMWRKRRGITPEGLQEKYHYKKHRRERNRERKYLEKGNGEMYQEKIWKKKVSINILFRIGVLVTDLNISCGSQV